MVGDMRCPGALHTVGARDGLLARVRIPGGLVTTAHVRALAAIADHCGDGNIDITSRASVQLRGLSETTQEACGAALIAAGLLPSSSHDRVRNIVAGPLAGVDPRELIDTRALVRALDAGIIADASFVALPAKFCFALDGGGHPFEDGGADLMLRAVSLPEGVAFHVVIGGVGTDIVAAPDRAVATLLAAARRALAFAATRACTRPWRLARLADARAAIVQALLAEGHAFVREVPRRENVPPLIPFGVFAAREAGRVNVLPTIPLGRLTAHQARGLAALADAVQGEVRFAPWRVVLADIARVHVPHIMAGLADLGLVLDGSDGYAGIAACAGIVGCAAALADVRGDAKWLAAQLSSVFASKPTGWRVNIAGCGKRCGMRRGANVELVATSNGYDVVRDGLLVATACTQDAALTYTVDAHRAQAGEVFA
jgi:precorrin-3B synthase